MAPLIGDKCPAKGYIWNLLLLSGTLRMEWLNISIAGNGVMRKMPIQLSKFLDIKKSIYLF